MLMKNDENIACTLSTNSVRANIDSSILSSSPNPLFIHSMSMNIKSPMLINKGVRLINSDFSKFSFWFMKSVKGCFSWRYSVSYTLVNIQSVVMLNPSMAIMLPMTTGCVSSVKPNKFMFVNVRVVVNMSPVINSVKPGIKNR